uniref:TSC22 domain family protein 1 n=1 Tax=Panagrellus redivivus TaxID=6233 RepID=A0A7E4UUL4_PANRE
MAPLPAAMTETAQNVYIGGGADMKNRRLSELFCNVWYGQKQPPFRLSSVGNASSSQIVAIDSKIEQAMDLVKTHLMFAVREEVDLLRGKIVELETAVYKLEAENSILREHVPNEVLQNLNGTPTNAGNPTQGSSIVAAQ